ncbi:hypothetical protein CPB84DRAFT_106925 [Gymnopilus junonius]|uniref:Transmembrane protein n=1 Tax=Gymnopilus junonius TaxID=109634 RepID=A0A9P5TR86_GYMJU|nr:hypothetical protein CPB84DRAFT_106925 [Gymnopilus junonius]
MYTNLLDALSLWRIRHPSLFLFCTHFGLQSQKIFFLFDSCTHHPMKPFDPFNPLALRASPFALGSSFFRDRSISSLLPKQTRTMVKKPRCAMIPFLFLFRSDTRRCSCLVQDLRRQRSACFHFHLYFVSTPVHVYKILIYFVLHLYLVSVFPLSLFVSTFFFKKKKPFFSLVWPPGHTYFL